MDLERVTAADFEPHIETEFQVGAESAGPRLRLTAVERQPVQPHAPRPEPFTLVFSGPGQPRLEQATYQLVHQVLGEFGIFLVPIAYAADGGLVYEAVFN